jgi:RNA polymerase sigma-70 factor (ECF subfamily)
MQFFLAVGRRRRYAGSHSKYPGESSTVAGDTTTDLHACLERLRAGDPQARGALIARAYDRLRRLAHRQMRGFDRVRRFDDTDDVLQNAALRLLRRLEADAPADPTAFFIWAAREIRCELIELARKLYGPLGAGRREAAQPDPAAADPGQTTHNPDRLARWREFHEQVERLPDDERQVFDLLWYQGLTRPEAAAVLGVSEPTVKRRWLAARLRLQSTLHLDGTEF